MGKPVEEKPGFRYVRIPGQKRVYAAETGADPSVEFEDWVDPDLLRLSTASLRRISILNYSLDQTFGRLINQERIALVRNEQGAWSAASGELSQPRIQQVINPLGRLRIKGVQPKAPDLAEGLREGRVELSLQTMLSLRPRGFHLSPMGQILAAEGELSAETAEGLVYQLRFGEVVTGTAQALEAGSAQAPSDDRYLFLTLRHDPKRQQQYSGSAEEDGPASRRAQALNRQFAEWFYVISGRDFELLRGGRKPAPRTPPSPPTPAGTSASLP